MSQEYDLTYAKWEAKQQRVAKQQASAGKSPLLERMKRTAAGICGLLILAYVMALVWIICYYWDNAEVGSPMIAISTIGTSPPLTASADPPAFTDATAATGAAAIAATINAITLLL